MKVLAHAAAAVLTALMPIVASGTDRETVRRAAEEFHNAQRVALEYLRTGNVDLAAVELDRLAAEWQGVGRHLRTADDVRLEHALTRVDQVLAEVRAAVDRDDPAAARSGLEAAAAPLDDWRAAHGLRIFADCVGEVNATFAAFDKAGRGLTDILNESAAAAVTQAAAATERALAVCDVEAPPDIRDTPEFRRLVDGFVVSLRLIPDALDRRDRDHLHRLIIEQRSFDRLLAFRFG